MKALLLIFALIMCFYLARVKAREARNLMTHTNYPEMLVGPNQYTTPPAFAA
ncbi:hypothetical protein [Pontibacter burrus]|uniref:Uncharacterized protein n=1 Tax=Pontibacter burrus TaxID=2704466 RepID=A0A6B3LN56_9BACT|nr:hypothetical protein [Pontibacter burrus]NEM96495.1 hypothetical protein [Pontibacter burrus]